MGVVVEKVALEWRKVVMGFVMRWVGGRWSRSGLEASLADKPCSYLTDPMTMKCNM